MSNGDPPPQSSAPYIIICSGRIEVAASEKARAKIVAAANCAAKFAAFMQSAYGENIEDAILPLSAIQHYLMVHLEHLSKNKGEAEAKIEELFAAMTALEHEY